MAEASRSGGASPEAAEGGRKRAREAADPAAVTDEEVEEFWAILRRLRRPVKSLEGGRSGKRWRPSFVAEDFSADGGEKAEEKRCEGGGALDLNVDPLTD
uniref:Uncharacterized protein n=1 Tax=Kalanchoe fedtschenkoi TaxID=63787 RepID=A0A7N0T8E8_KALFE